MILKENEKIQCISLKEIDYTKEVQDFKLIEKPLTDKLKKIRVIEKVRSKDFIVGGSYSRLPLQREWIDNETFTIEESDGRGHIFQERTYKVIREKNVCPLCGSEDMEYPAISRKDNKTKICSACGQAEALKDFFKN